MDKILNQPSTIKNRAGLKRLLNGLVLLTACGGAAFLMAAGTAEDKIPIRGDWFEVAYNEIRDMTVILPKDHNKYGEEERTPDGDRLRFDVYTQFQGKVLLGNTPIGVWIEVSRLAADKWWTMTPTPDTEDNYRVYSSHGIYILNKCHDAAFLTSSGDRFQLSDKEVEYETKKTGGPFETKEIHEMVTLWLSWSQLNQLRDGAKIDMGEGIEFALHKDSISKIRTVIAITEDQAPKDKKDSGK